MKNLPLIYRVDLETNSYKVTKLTFRGECSMAYVITSPCMTEKAADCMDVCSVDCIELGADQYFINPVECIDCGACEFTCPVEAIFHEDDLAEEDESFLEKAKKHFQLS